MQSQETDFDVAVIGGGASGALVATHYREVASFSQRLALIEASGRPGRGVAYDTQLPGHLLNVPASRMSAYASEPDHFATWLAQHLSDARADSYAPRMLYGEYLNELLDKQAPLWPEIVHVEDRASRITRSDRRWIVHLGGGARLASRNVVVALGNLPPRDPVRFASGPPAGYVPDPWRRAALQGIAPDAPVLLAGTGLTMYDVVQSLRAQGHRGPLHALSRHGRTPAARRGAWPRPLGSLPPEGASPVQCLRWLRAEIASAARGGYDWRTVVDGVRNRAASIWSRWTLAQKSSFLRHARSFWDSHRHRVAPQVHEQIEALRRDGTLRILSGRLLSVVETDAAPDGTRALEVRWRVRGSSDEQTMSFAHVVNCTGPATDYARIDEPLVAQLRAAGWLVPDALGLGMETEEDGAFLDRDGRRVPGLYAIGPMRRPGLWETTSIPEIRAQAAALARQFAPAGSRAHRRIVGQSAEAAPEDASAAFG
jgi:uncharacterized NAD(P)/FAD-binding protein YdhS